MRNNRLSTFTDVIGMSKSCDNGGSGSIVKDDTDGA